jgi:peptidyl-prolyl cis-trans isomerase SurA
MPARVLLLFVFLSTGSRAEIIDRIAVAVDNQVITESEVLREIGLTEFLNADPLDFSPGTKKKAADRLIEQKLIRKEMGLGRYAEPNPDEVLPLLNQIQTERFHSAEAYRQALEKYGITEEELKAHLLWQLTLLHFIDVRFRPGVQVSDDDVRAYLETKLREMHGSDGPDKNASPDDLRDKIRETLTSQRVDKQLDDWLAETRKHARVKFHPEAFQ